MRKLLIVGTVTVVVVALLLALTAVALGADKGDPKPVVSADSAIVSVRAIGFVDTDGAKLSAIDIEYNVDMNGSDVSLDKYVITDYGISTAPVPEIGSNPGVATRAYVKDKTHVIIEVNTDYQLGSVAKSYKWAMIGRRHPDRHHPRPHQHHHSGHGRSQELRSSCK